MTPERWARIEELFHRAAECAPKDRAGVLEGACTDDPELRREVEALLSSEGKAGDSVRAAVRGGLDDVGFPLTGETVSHYSILDGVGGGGMGLVYRAEDIKLGRRVALKFLPEEFVKDSRALGRFEREARSASALEHPNICPIYEFGEYEGRPFIVMQLLEGQTLRQLISGAGQEKPPLELSRLVDLATQITDGLDAAHRQGIIHRDIKPANIFVTSQGQAKILDFGLAKLTAETVTEENSELNCRSDLGTEGAPRETVAITTPDSFLSRTSVAMGTTGYMSPEQVRGEKLDARTDLFSFGSVLYEMATGKRAFDGDTGSVRQEAVLKQKPSPARKLNPKIPAGLEAIINRALEKERDVRYQSAAAIVADLKRLKRARKSTRWVALTATTIVVLGLAVGSRLFFSRKAHALTDKDTIVLADFTNSTGDAVFDGTLRQGLSIQLEQSPFLSIVSDRQIQETLQMMEQKPDTRLTPKIARDLCQRTGSAAVLDGSIARLGTQYVLGLKAENCRSGDLLAEEQVQANDKEQVLNALGGAAARLRRKLGESLSTVEKFNTPIEQVTTSSLEALHAYGLGRAVINKGEYPAAVPFLQRAIQLDPNFAMAYASLGLAFSHSGAEILGMENTQKAFELRGRVSERERFYIEARYHQDITGDLEKVRQINELWAQTYPRDELPHRNLGWDVYHALGQHEHALAELQEALRVARSNSILDPSNSVDYRLIAIVYIHLNRFDDARATIEEAQKKNLDSPSLHFSLYALAFLRNDTTAMGQQVAWSKGKAQVEDQLLAFEANTAAYFGRLAKARELSRQAVASAERGGGKDWMADCELDAAYWEALFGSRAESRKHALAALKLSTGRDVQLQAAAELARAGYATEAHALADDLAKRFPDDTRAQLIRLPMVRAQLALNRKDFSRVIELLQSVAPYELAGALDAVHVRGNAYLATQQGSEAAAEFQKILDHPGTVVNEPIGALAHLQIGRAYALEGDTAKARAAYKDFLALWKDADPDILILKEAKAEDAKLQ